MSVSRAAVFQGVGRALEFRELPLPEPGDGEILVSVAGCTLCGSDLHTFDGRREVALPTILGHEIVGEIASFGTNTARRDIADNELHIGDRVTWAIVASCGDCFFCRRDLPQKCLTAVKYGHEAIRPGRELSGGLAAHCLLARGTSLLRLPEELPLSVACPASCATATVAAAVSAAGRVQQRNVCVFGMGLLGLTTAAMLRTSGAANVVCVDVNAERLGRAAQFGATHAVTPDEFPGVLSATTGGHGFDVVLELSGSPAACATGLESLRLGGTLVLVGSVFPTPPMEIPPEQIVRRNLTIRGVHNYAPGDLLNAVRFLTKHHQTFPFADLVGAWYPLEESAAAFAASREPGNIRIGVGPQAL